LSSIRIFLITGAENGPRVFDGFAIQAELMRMALGMSAREFGLACA
jgi:hypothetical protein